MLFFVLSSFFLRQNILKGFRSWSESGMKGCALCEEEARMYCESDQASLCWECDAQVHGANFLVARHARVLLCRRCQAPTPWQATGARLSPINSACDRCSGINEAGQLGEDAEEDDFDEDDTDMDVEEEEESEDYQVVPWAPSSPPPAASSSSSDESSSPLPGRSSNSRTREITDLRSKNDPSCHFPLCSRLNRSMQASFSSRLVDNEDSMVAPSSFRISKDHPKSFLQTEVPFCERSAGARTGICDRLDFLAGDL